MMASLPNVHFPFIKPVFTGSFYFITDQVDAPWKEVKEKVEICYPIKNFDYGMREFALFDNDGYLLLFKQPFIEKH